jgi:hypothetical protein
MNTNLFTEAQEFFSVQPQATQWGDNPYAEKDTMVQFIAGIPVGPQPDVNDRAKELRRYLVDLAAIVTDYVFRYSNAYGTQYKADAQLWSLAMSKLPLMSASSLTDKTFSKYQRGTEIAPEFIRTLLDIEAKGESSQVASFRSFSEQQGALIRMGIGENKEGYRTITLAMSVVPSDNQSALMPKIRLYRRVFDQSDTKWVSACGSAEMVDIKFQYTYAEHSFDYRALQDPEIKQQFDRFIDGCRKADIRSATTYFDADFPV